MAYSDFTLKEAASRLGLTIEERVDLFAATPEGEPSEPLTRLLERYDPLARAISTEKARSEFLIAPILAEVRDRPGRRISLFSGVEFAVDESLGLTGACGNILAASPEQLFLSTPVAVVVEAKREDIRGGLGRCVAAMVAARLYKEREGNRIAFIHGAVTTGTIWRFLRLEATMVYLDARECYVPSLAKILGILVSFIPQHDGGNRLVA